MEVLYEFPKDADCIYHATFLPISSCSNGFVVVSRDQIYRISEYNFSTPKLICDARWAGWDIAAMFLDGGNALKHVTSITCDPGGKIFFCDGRVNYVQEDGRYRVVAGSTEPGFVDSPDGTRARFGVRLLGICCLNGKLVVSDCFNNALRYVDPELGSVCTLLGRKEESEYFDKKSSSHKVDLFSSDGDFEVATLRDPGYVLVGSGSNNIINVICSGVNIDYSEYTVRRVNLTTRNVQTVAGKSYSLPEIKDGVQGVSRLSYTVGAAIDGHNNIYMASEDIIRRVSTDGVTSTIFKNYLKDGSPGYIKALVFDKRKTALILFDNESVKSIKLE